MFLRPPFESQMTRLRCGAGVSLATLDAVGFFGRCVALRLP